MPTPGASVALEQLDLRDPCVVAGVFERAARLNLEDPFRKGSLIDLPPRGRLLMTGDLHDEGLNFHRIRKLAALDRSPDNRVILHEVIHGPGRVNGRDLSVRMLAQVAALKVQFPAQVFILQSNHELAQLTGESILKDGMSVVEAFDEGLSFLFSDDADMVRTAMKSFLRSLPLAVRCQHTPGGGGGVFCSHSLPGPRKIDVFDKAVLQRVPSDADLKPGGSAYLMVWGRHHNQKVADELAGAWLPTARNGHLAFIMGHQPAEMGYQEEGDTMLVLASDHSHGVALPIDLSRRYTRDDLIGELVPLASVVL